MPNRLACEIRASAADAVWPALLSMLDYLNSSPSGGGEQVALHFVGGAWEFAPGGDSDPNAATSVRIPLTLAAEAEALAAGKAAGNTFLYSEFANGGEPFALADNGAGLDGETQTILRVYLPCVVGGYRARQADHLFVVAHLAQTLDGRIACNNGHSQWISNEANLHHAHRLRALCDSVIVGAGTVRSDDPELTVRHVAGRHPRRVVLNASADLVRGAADYKVHSGPGSLFLCGAGATDAPVTVSEPSEVVELPAAEARWIDPVEAGRALTARGIHTAFLEGGGRSVSRFLEASAIDILHVHIAPLILGSGIPAFALPEVTSVQAGCAMHARHFSMDGEFLFECIRPAFPTAEGSA